MSARSRLRPRVVLGTIRRRLLVNAVVDPDEVARRLPDGLRPHLTADGTVVGCCLLEIEQVRPADGPAVLGRRLRAAAHRISASWEDNTRETVIGVYVPMRHTDSRLAVTLGGRWFPGVHARARGDVSSSESRLCWAIEPARGQGLGLRVAASIPLDSPTSVACDPVGGTCLEATVGVSPDHRGVLEAVRMRPDHRDACEVVVEELDSAFLSSFTTARAAPSYLMRDAAVTWTPAPRPVAESGMGGRTVRL